MKQTIVLWAALMALACAAATPENIARGKKYTFSTPPHYHLTDDAGDATQLTDGAYAKAGSGGFWCRKEAVGWGLGGMGDRVVTVDLEKDEPLTGFGWNFGAGSAGVAWPDLIFVYVSTDGKAWRFAGDLYGKSKEADGGPNEDGYGVYFARSLKMPSHGRYVAFLARSTNYLFVDEVEVYRGPAENAQVGDGEDVGSPMRHYAKYRAHKAFYADAERIARASEGLTEAGDREVTEALYRVNAAVMRAKGHAAPFLWEGDRWASADLLDLPKAAAGQDVTVEMMRGETRSCAVNLSNPGQGDLETDVRIVGMPEGARVEVREVVPMLIKMGARKGSLIQPNAAGSSLRVKVPSGTTKQLWISFAKPTLAAGTYTGTIAAAGASVPLTLKVANCDFPARPRLHVGGWDYVENGNKFYRAPGNLKPKMARMAEMFVDTPWAGSGVMPGGAKFDREDGRLLNAEQLSFKTWNDWVDVWGDQARQYCVFMSVRDTFRGEKMGTPRFNRMVGDYMRAWYDGIRDKLNGRRVIILLFDEPSKPENDAIIVAWARAVKAAAPEFVIFEDVDYSDPQRATREMIDACEILCPPTPTITARKCEDFYLKQRTEGKKELWLYSCCGPVRMFDPIAYHRAQAWVAWKLGAKATQFWAFGCGGGLGDSFRPFEQPGTEYSPFFVSPTDAFRAKHSEAVMESVEDYEYFALFSEKIAREKAAGKDTAALEKLLADVVEAGIPKEEWLKNNTYSFGGAYKRYDWSLPRDHVSMDAGRIRILHALAD